MRPVSRGPVQEIALPGVQLRLRHAATYPDPSQAHEQQVPLLVVGHEDPVSAAVHGVSRLEMGTVITPADTEAALWAQELTVQPGDALLFHTGWGRQWGTDDAGYVEGEPGPGSAMVDWLVDQRVSVTGCDTWSFGPVPAEDPDEPFVVPQTLNAKHGIVVLENLHLAELADARVGQFLFIVSHAKLRGATGAWVAPLAIV